MFSKKSFENLNTEGYEGNIIGLPINSLIQYIKELEKSPNIKNINYFYY